MPAVSAGTWVALSNLKGTTSILVKCIVSLMATLKGIRQGDKYNAHQFFWIAVVRVKTFISTQTRRSLSTNLQIFALGILFYRNGLACLNARVHIVSAGIKITLTYLPMNFDIYLKTSACQL